MFCLLIFRFLLSWIVVSVAEEKVADKFDLDLEDDVTEEKGNDDDE